MLAENKDLVSVNVVKHILLGFFGVFFFFFSFLENSAMELYSNINFGDLISLSKYLQTYGENIIKLHKTR
jgi:hypothetical protein